MDTTIQVLTPTAQQAVSYNPEASVSFVRPYDPKQVAIQGFRVSVVRYRDTTKGTAIKPAKMVIIPQVSLPDDYLMPELASKVFLGVIEDAQDAIVRQKIEEACATLAWADVSLDAALLDLTAVRVSQRLTKEQIEAWAKVACAPAFDARSKEISDSKQHSEEQRKAQRAGTENAYIANLAKLAAPVPNLGQETAVTLQSFLTKAELADDLSKTLLAKLHAILNPVAANAGDL